ncbi:hypothetical protein K457DRAFT_1880418 [Linnemannia elongata AG-77]|uniref:Uncharacterized protein n=1 Tax=Linnemannia elongata AG-77 TaxID=1314771 RepID=A0A197JJR4_9FUNG|nr:hypothetical protein K457DRAFT_1880418 [Linnemannia elongata AG-77]
MGCCPWEQTQGISAKDKTSKYTGPRGDWSQGYGYITLDGFCPCGASLATHEDRICPGATKEPRTADERLLETTIVAQSQVSDRTVTDGWFTEEFGLDLDPKWHISDLLRGITPKSVLSEWSSVFRSPKSIAQTVLHKFVGYLEAQASELIWKPRCSETIAWEQAQGITTKDKTSNLGPVWRIAKTVLHKFVGYLETQASERIWKPRCSATIAWEQTQGISAKDKTSKYTGPRGDWSQGYGYITLDGFCPCGASLATHEDRICPGATKEPRAADERLLETATIVAQSQVPDRTVTGGWCTEEFL